MNHAVIPVDRTVRVAIVRPMLHLSWYPGETVVSHYCPFGQFFAVEVDVWCLNERQLLRICAFPNYCGAPKFKLFCN